MTSTTCMQGLKSSITLYNTVAPPRVPHRQRPECFEVQPARLEVLDTLHRARQGIKVRPLGLEHLALEHIRQMAMATVSNVSGQTHKSEKINP